MARPRHPNKHIEAAVKYAEALGWRVEISGGHAWGRIFCPHAVRGGCKKSVWSTPHNPQGHASQIRRAVDQCPHHDENQDDTQN
jgi:hypothetical protein